MGFPDVEAGLRPRPRYDPRYGRGGGHDSYRELPRVGGRTTLTIFRRGQEATRAIRSYALILRLLRIFSFNKIVKVHVPTGGAFYHIFFSVLFSFSLSFHFFSAWARIAAHVIFGSHG